MCGHRSLWRAAAWGVLLAGGLAATALPARAQRVTDSMPRSPGRPMTKQELADACNHRPNARLRLYGCTAEAMGVTGPPPILIVDGVVRVVDSAQTRSGRPPLEALGISASEVISVTVIKGDSAVVRFGTRARGGALIVVTKRDSVFVSPDRRR